MAKKLTDKQRMFCLEYLKDLNATQAAIRAGYSQDSAYSIGSENMTKPEIRAYVRELMDERSKDVLVDNHFVLENLIEVSQRSLQSKPVLEWNHEKRCYEETGEYEFDSNGANRALELLGKHLGLFKDKIELDHKGNITINVTPVGVVIPLATSETDVDLEKDERFT